jgi:hypothetical protein
MTEKCLKKPENDRKTAKNDRKTAKNSLKMIPK